MCRDELKRTLQALSAPYESQIRLFPEFVCVGDELVLEFGDAYAAYLAGEPRVTREQDMQLRVLSRRIDELSGRHGEGFWSDVESLRTHRCWEELRLLAKSALDAFGWAPAEPRPSLAIFVGVETAKGGT